MSIKIPDRKELKLYIENDIDTQWPIAEIEDVVNLAQSFNQFISIYIEEAQFNGDYYLLTSYYSSKLNLTINLDSDSDRNYANADDFIDMLIEYSRQAKAIEARII